MKKGKTEKVVTIDLDALEEAIVLRHKVNKANLRNIRWVRNGMEVKPRKNAWREKLPDGSWKKIVETFEETLQRWEKVGLRSNVDYACSFLLPARVAKGATTTKINRHKDGYMMGSHCGMQLGLETAACLIKEQLKALGYDEPYLREPLE